MKLGILMAFAIYAASAEFNYYGLRRLEKVSLHGKLLDRNAERVVPLLVSFSVSSNVEPFYVNTISSRHWLRQPRSSDCHVLCFLPRVA